jgi:hypothetical protein
MLDIPSVMSVDGGSEGLLTGQGKAVHVDACEMPFNHHSPLPDRFMSFPYSQSHYFEQKCEPSSTTASDRSAV